MSSLLTSSFITLFERDLNRLESEINQYEDEKLLWVTAGQIPNSPGNLCLHLCGNLQNYIGAILGKTGYQRNRPYEFSAKGLSKTFLLEEIARTKKAVAETLKKIDDEQMHLTYPEETLGFPMTTIFFLNHLFGHFGYHLGQINYHRRMIEAALLNSRR